MATKEDKNKNFSLELSEDFLMETLERSPLFVEMPKDECETLKKALHKEGFYEPQH